MFVRKQEIKLGCFQGSYWTMDGPSDVTEVRAPKRPYPDEDDEEIEEEGEEDVCF